LDNLVKKAIPFIFAFIAFIISLTILSSTGLGKFPAQGISIVIAYLVQNFVKKMIPSKNELSKDSSMQLNEETGPLCPECNGNNTYLDYQNNLFCRKCLKITVANK
jgi:hypothetical protein